MLDIGLSELMVFAVIALVVLGPDKLPVALKTAARYYVKIKKFVSNIQRDIEKELNITELKHMMQEEMHRIEALELEMQQKFAELERQQREFAAEHKLKQKSQAIHNQTVDLIKADQTHATFEKKSPVAYPQTTRPSLKAIRAIGPIVADEAVKASMDETTDASSSAINSPSQDLRFDEVTAEDTRQLYVYYPATHRTPFLTRYELRRRSYIPRHRNRTPYYQVAV